MSLEVLKKKVLNCNKCGLAKTRNNIIFGEGNHNASVFLIGEAPGKDEDLLGHPFVGLSGQLLDKILDNCGFKRNEHVYLSNIIKCRPPSNRVPLLEEIQKCKPFLLMQIDLINPRIIILLGAIALKNIIDPDMKIIKTRGNWINWENRLVMPVYHPSALLRNPELKRDTWEDFKKIVFKYKEIVNPYHYSAYV